MSSYATHLKDLPEVFKSMSLKEDHNAEVLLLTCIDFRFFDEVEECIKAKGLGGKFDHVIVAGAELGPVIDFPPDPKLHWQQFFLEHLQLSRQLHCIKKVLVLGHRDCGAYKKFKLLPEDNVDPETERLTHELQARKLANLISVHQPGLEFEAHLLEDTP